MVYLNFDINSPLLICHKCDNPQCFNPDHLFAGTVKDNAVDSSKKLRHCGSSHHRSKMKEEDAVLIKKLLSTGLSPSEVSKKTGIKVTTIQSIKLNRIWKSILPNTQMRFDHKNGERNVKAKLTKEKILKIREMVSNGIAYSEIAKQFMVSDSLIGSIVSRKSWKHVRAA